MKRLILVIMISRIFTYNLPPQSEIESMTKSEKIILYKNYDKSIGIAMSLNLIPLPFFHFGFAYINDWKRGFIYDAAFVGNLSLLSYAYNSEVLSGKQLGDMLIITNIVIYAFKSYDLIQQTKKYNHNLYNRIIGEEFQKIGLNILPAYQGVTFTMNYDIN